MWGRGFVFSHVHMDGIRACKCWLVLSLFTTSRTDWLYRNNGSEFSVSCTGIHDHNASGRRCGEFCESFITVSTKQDPSNDIWWNFTSCRNDRPDRYDPIHCELQALQRSIVWSWIRFGVVWRNISVAWKHLYFSLCLSVSPSKDKIQLNILCNWKHCSVSPSSLQRQIFLKNETLFFNASIFIEVRPSLPFTTFLRFNLAHFFLKEGLL